MRQMRRVRILVGTGDGILSLIIFMHAWRTKLKGNSFGDYHIKSS
jgi:hypothetical protein